MAGEGKETFFGLFQRNFWKSKHRSEAHFLKISCSENSQTHIVFGIRLFIFLSKICVGHSKNNREFITKKIYIIGG